MNHDEDRRGLAARRTLGSVWAAVLIMAGFALMGRLPRAQAAELWIGAATATANMVGPEGGQVLVERTVEAIKALWADPR